MKIGVIAEGKSDFAVVRNILRAFGVDGSDILSLQPELEYDETSLHTMKEDQFSNWTLVRKACREGNKIYDFVDGVADERFVIVQIDTDVRSQKDFEVLEPSRLVDDESVKDLIVNVRLRVDSWLTEVHEENPQSVIAPEKIALAISVEEIDAWVLTLFVEKGDTGLLTNPKERLRRIWNEPNRMSSRDRKAFFNQLERNPLNAYDEQTKDFRKRPKLDKFADKNYSLKYFCTVLEVFLPSEPK